MLCFNFSHYTDDFEDYFNKYLHKKYVFKSKFYYELKTLFPWGNIISLENRALDYYSVTEALSIVIWRYFWVDRWFPQSRHRRLSHLDYLITTIQRKGNDYRAVASYIVQIGIPMLRYYDCPLNCEVMAGQLPEECPNLFSCRMAFCSRIERALIAIYGY